MIAIAFKGITVVQKFSLGRLIDPDHPFFAPIHLQSVQPQVHVFKEPEILRKMRHAKRNPALIELIDGKSREDIDRTML